MTVAVDLDTIGAAIMSAPPSEVAPLPEPETVVTMPEAIPAPANTPAAPGADLMTLDEFGAGWGMCHHMAGGVLSSRMGAPVPLGDQGMSETGMEACKASYELAKQYAPFLLNKQNGTFGKIAAVAMHGFTCIQIIKTARTDAANSASAPAASFKTTRKEPE